jgi:hypothetical protein
MFSKIDFNKAAFDSLKPQIIEELERREVCKVDRLEYFGESTQYCRLWPVENHFSPTHQNIVSFLSVHFDERMIECNLIPENFDCVKEFFSIKKGS